MIFKRSLNGFASAPITTDRLRYLCGWHVSDAIQCCGGYGFVRRLGGSGEDWPLESIYRDAKIGEIYEGANEVQKWIITRKIFGRAITG